MFRNYLKTAWRNLLKNRQFTLLNLTGLSTGLACALLIYLWVHDEWQMDKFHEHDSRLFQVMENRSHTEGIRTVAETSVLLGETLTRELPSEVAYATTITPPSWFSQTLLSVNGQSVKAAAIFAGADYFRIFSYRLKEGNKEQVLSVPNGIVISEKLAEELFHTKDGITGRTVSWQLGNAKSTATVTGVFEGTPASSSVQFDFVLPFPVFRNMMNITGNMDGQNSWGPFLTYVVLNKKVDVPRFNAQLSRLMREHSKAQQRDMFLKPYSDNYLYGNYENGVQSGGRIRYVQLFSLIALFIIVIACINFMNLSTAKAAGRMKEIGIRKTIGAGRSTLVLQYIGESILMAFLSLAAALLLVTLLLPAFNQITGKQLTFHFHIAFLLITLLTGLLAGSYPALYLSGFNPVTILKGKLSNSGGAMWARKGLVVFQFTISVVFIVAVLVVYRQITYVQTMNLGYKKDHVITFEAEGEVAKHLETFLSEIRKMPGVVNASAMVGSIVQNEPPTVGLPWKQDVIMIQPFQVDYGLMETLGIEMAAGRTFSREFGMDTAKIILNEAAVKAMGIKDPVGKVIGFGGNNREIIGVTRNFHFQSLHDAVKPSFFLLEPRCGTVMVKIRAGEERAAADRLSTFTSSYNPGFPFTYKFLDDDFQAQYVAEKRVAVLSKYFAGLAVIISCLGLFGLAAFTAEKRRKEIGIRKILGASVNSVLLMLTKDFLRSVLIAVLIAIPLAWWIMTQWLQGFAYHISLGADVFFIAAGIMLFITLLTISFQSVKAALTNPVRNLRAE